MTTVRVSRFDPEHDTEPHIERYEVPSGTGFMVLDALNHIREHHDPSLRYRHSCHMGKCGTCAVKVNGEPQLACWHLVKDGQLIEPLAGLPVVADLVVERREADLYDGEFGFSRPPEGHRPCAGELERVELEHRPEIDLSRTCINCFACYSVCPYIHADERVFVGPKQMVEIARWAYDPRLEAGRNLGVAIHQGIWDCVACDACTQACPQEIDPKQRILDLREMILDRPALGGVPPLIRDTNLTLYRSGRPHPSSGSLGVERLREVGVKILTEGEKADWLFFAGCTNWDDEIEAQATCDLATTLVGSGLELGTLGNEEICCGDPARFTGEAGLFEHQRDQLTELLERYEVRKIVTGCPHALHLLKTAYDLDVVEVRHLVEVLEELAAAGRLSFQSRIDQVVAYHDPCYLGRYSGVYDAPRSLLGRIPGLRLVEMEDARSTSLCCGGGGGGAFQEIEATPRLAWTRVRQAVDAGADTLAVACPTCKQMLTDAATTLDLNLRVEHISELLYHSIYPSDRRC